MSKISAGRAPLSTWLRQVSLKMYVATLPAKIPTAVKTCHETSTRPLFEGGRTSDSQMLVVIWR